MQDMKRLGFQYPDDMSWAIQSAVWHKFHDRPTDVKLIATCLAAWNSESVRLHRASRGVGQPIAMPEFDCIGDEALRAGMQRWSVVNR